MAIKATNNHTTLTNKGEPNDFAIAAGVRKIPSAIDSPITTAIAAVRPSCLRSFVVCSGIFSLVAVDTAVGMVVLPIEPEVFKRINPLQALSPHRSGNSTTLEGPLIE